MQTIRTVEDVEDGLARLIALDPRLASVAVLAGPLPLRLGVRGYAGLAEVIVSQMVSKASANAIWHRLEQATGDISDVTVAALSPEACRRIGLSRAKAVTLQRVASAVMEGRLDPVAVCRMDAAAAMAQLTAISGIGPWTAEVYLMLYGGHPDIFPAGDVALRASVAHALRLEQRPDNRQLAALAAVWSPWRSIAARLFWAYYAKQMRRNAAPAGV